MKKIYFLLSLSLLSVAAAFGQSTGWNIPDSAKTIAKPGSGPGPNWNYTNPLVHNGTQYSPFIMCQGAVNNKSDFLYLHDLGFTVPGNATITGVEVIIRRFGCNTGDYARDTISLAHNNAAIGNVVTDSVPSSGATDTLGSSSNMWGNTLTPAMVNSYTFGVIYSYGSFGVCTFGVFDCRIKVHYTVPTGVEGVAISNAIRVYPNPATSSLVIETGNGNYNVTDQLGRVVLNGVISDNSTTVDISVLNPGLYFMHSGNEVVKFVKQ